MKGIELLDGKLMCGICQQPIAAGVPFIPAMAWGEEQIDTFRAGPDGRPRQRPVRIAYLAAGLHLECMGKVKEEGT